MVNLKPGSLGLALALIPLISLLALSNVKWGGAETHEIFPDRNTDTNTVVEEGNTQNKRYVRWQANHTSRDISIEGKSRICKEMIWAEVPLIQGWKSVCKDTPKKNEVKDMGGIFNRNLTVEEIGISLLGKEKYLEVLKDSTMDETKMGDHVIRVHHHKNDKNWIFGKMDKFVVREGSPILLLKEKGSYGADSQVYVEIGANIGTAAVFASKTYPDLQTISVEASPINAFYLAWNLIDNGMTIGPKHIVINRAILKDNRRVQFSTCPAKSRGLSHMGETLESEGKCSVDLFHVDVKGIRASEVFSLARSYSVDYLRLDCEGCELEILDDLKEWDLWDRILAGSGEAHPPMWEIYLDKKENLNAVEAEYCLHSFKSGKSVFRADWGWKCPDSSVLDRADATQIQKEKVLKEVMGARHASL